MLCAISQDIDGENLRLECAEMKRSTAALDDAMTHPAFPATCEGAIGDERHTILDKVSNKRLFIPTCCKLASLVPLLGTVVKQYCHVSVVANLFKNLSKGSPYRNVAQRCPRISAGHINPSNSAVVTVVVCAQLISCVL